jgi:hypothetical protein
MSVLRVHGISQATFSHITDATLQCLTLWDVIKPTPGRTSKIRDRGTHGIITTNIERDCVNYCFTDRGLELYRWTVEHRQPLEENQWISENPRAASQDLEAIFLPGSRLAQGLGASSPLSSERLQPPESSPSSSGAGTSSSQENA